MVRGLYRLKPILSPYFWEQFRLLLYTVVVHEQVSCRILSCCVTRWPRSCSQESFNTDCCASERKHAPVRRLPSMSALLRSTRHSQVLFYTWPYTFAFCYNLQRSITHLYSSNDSKIKTVKTRNKKQANKTFIVILSVCLSVCHTPILWVNASA